MHFPHSKLLGFTLVELIVVITIVGILSTVGFVSYSGYLTGARDSNRYSQMTKLSDSLQTYAASKSLPLPDDSIDITASGSTNVIAYQGYVGVDVLETIDYTNGGKDPKDDSYFTYYLTKDRKSMQLMGFMEEKKEFSFNKNVYAGDYSNRYPKTYGNNLGALVSAEEDSLNSPAQDIAGNIVNGYLDVFHTTENYAADFGIRGVKIGTGNILGLELIGRGALIGKWSFDEGSGTTAINTSSFDNNGAFSGTVHPNYTIGKKGDALDFLGNSNVNDEGSLVIVNNNLDNLDTPFFSYSFWLMPDYQSDEYPNHYGQVVKNYSSESIEAIFQFIWSHVKTDHRQSCSVFTISGEWVNAQIKGSLNISDWNHIACVYGDEKLSVYVNGKINNTVKVSSPVVRGDEELHFGAGSQNSPESMGAVSFFNGKIDEFYLYKRTLSPFDIEYLYKMSQ